MTINFATKTTRRTFQRYYSLCLRSNAFTPVQSHPQVQPPQKCNLTFKIFPTRWCSSGSDNKTPSPQQLPPLMNFPHLVWPSVIKSIRNFLLATFIIKPYMDREFNLSDFVNGSKKAVEVVSNKLSEGDLKNLDGFVAGDIVDDLRKNVSLMSLSQREQLAIVAEDIYFSFPYQVGIIFDDDDKEHQKRYVEITMVYHSLRGLTAMRNRGEEPPINMGMLPDYQKRIAICNYRFIREFTKGVEGDWTVNLLNHFRPIDDVNDD